MFYWNTIVDDIKQATGKPFVIKSQQSLAGGCINSAYLLTGEKTRYFVKTNNTGKRLMFEAEVQGLRELATSKAIKVPAPLCAGDDGVQSYIVLEYLAMNGRADQIFLGEQLAAMHKVTAKRFGWFIDNTIGATSQINTLQDNWLTFWREQRLGYQLELAAQKGHGRQLQDLGERLLAVMPALFAGRQVAASMLHGDLWGGNVAGLNDGTPVIFDPAFYYGDRETDIAMTYLFGGFSADFYASYKNVFPLDDGFVLRKTFYNIYHILNHLNMFGSGYHSQLIDMMERVLAELG